jgi:hypothetical protein
MPEPHVLLAESAIAAAHERLTNARDITGDWSDLGLHDDIELILLELERIQMDLLRGRRRRLSLLSPSRVSQTEDRPQWPRSLPPRT